jgi:type VI secretion system secreted protein VgrG
MTEHATDVRQRALGHVRANHIAAAHAEGARSSATTHSHNVRATLREKPAGAVAATVTTAFDPIIGAAATRSAYHVDGTGMTVAVIDTGVDYKNAALGAGFGPGAKVVAGYDFADNSPDPMATSSQHGTAVAGLIGSNNPTDLGVAPGVSVVALRVTDASNTGSLNSVASALQWVIDHHAEYNITAVNMSLSDGQNYARNWFASGGGVPQQITNLIGQLKGLNIPVVAATGNNFTGHQGEGFAAIVSDTISVTATDLSGNLLPNAQRLGSTVGGSSATTIAAPGDGLTAPSGDSGAATVEGTSFATPLVTGAVVLLQQIYDLRFGTLPTVDQLKSWLQQGSDPVADPVTGITIGRLDIPKAAALVPGAPAQSAPVITTPPTNVPPASATPPAPVVSTPPAPAVPAPPAPVASAPPAPVASTPPGMAVSDVAPTSPVSSNTPLNRSSGSSSSGTSGATQTSSVDEFWKAVTVWAANDASAAWSSGFTQVQVWNA